MLRVSVNGSGAPSPCGRTDARKVSRCPSSRTGEGVRDDLTTCTFCRVLLHLEQRLLYARATPRRRSLMPSPASTPNTPRASAGKTVPELAAPVVGSACGVWLAAAA